ncbi:MAG: hypothetical protein WCK01_00370 [Candidatus Uhrbacteria bacterium]
MTYPNLTAWERREEYEAQLTLVRESREHHASVARGLARSTSAAAEHHTELRNELERVGQLQIDVQRESARDQVAATERQTDAIAAMRDDLSTGFAELGDAVGQGLDRLERTLAGGIDRLAVLLEDVARVGTWPEEFKRFQRLKKGAFDALQAHDADRSLQLAVGALRQKGADGLVDPAIEDDPEINALGAKLIAYQFASKAAIDAAAVDPFALARRALARGRRSSERSEKQAAADAAALLAIEARGCGRLDAAADLERAAYDLEQTNRLAAGARLLAALVPTANPDDLAPVIASRMVLFPSFAALWIANASLFSYPDRTKVILARVRAELATTHGQATAELEEQRAQWKRAWQAEPAPWRAPPRIDPSTSVVELAAGIRSAWAAVRQNDDALYGATEKQLAAAGREAETESTRASEKIAASVSQADRDVDTLRARTKSGILSFSTLANHAWLISLIAFIPTCCLSWNSFPHRLGTQVSSTFYAMMTGVGGALVCLLSAAGVLVIGQIVTSVAIAGARAEGAAGARAPRDRLERIRAARGAAESVARSVQEVRRAHAIPAAATPRTGRDVMENVVDLHASLASPMASYAQLTTAEHVEPAGRARVAIIALRGVLHGTPAGPVAGVGPQEGRP